MKIKFKILVFAFIYKFSDSVKLIRFSNQLYHEREDHGIEMKHFWLPLSYRTKFILILIFVK